MSVDLENAVNALENDGREYLHAITLSANSFAEFI